MPPASLIVVDEAHRFRNPATRRYDRLARDLHSGRVLLLSATPVVNAAADLVHLLRLFLADHALAPFGVPSLADAAADHAALAHAVLPLTVTRTASLCHLAQHLPATSEGSVLRIGTLDSGRMERVLDGLRQLRFPPLGENGGALLPRHLLLRLASSADALAASLHPRYRVMPIAFTSPLFGALLGLVLGGESLSLKTGLGMALTVGGIVLLSL